MKAIKIFLASSDELKDDRMAFGNLVHRLNKIYEKRGVHIELFEWEDFDAAFNGVRKQDEYNAYIKESDMFLALFHTKAGKFTIEEFDVATEEFRKHASPKVYTYCRDLKPGEQETPELTEFKRRLFEELEYYWYRYSNLDSMHLHFVMQLQLVESSGMSDLKVEDGNVTLDGNAIAKMENLPFVAGNEDYQNMQSELQTLPGEIEAFRMQMEANVGNEMLQNLLQGELQKKLNRYNQLKDDFEKHQQLLFNTAKQVASLQGERVTERMRRAMDAFNEGKVREANIILAEAEKDAASAFEDYKRSREISEQKRQNVESSIEELILKASTIMADTSLPIERRIEQAEKIYAQADGMAQEISLSKKKHLELLSDYGDFLSKYAKYEDALSVFERAITFSQVINKQESENLSKYYNRIGFLHHCLGDYSKALEYYHKSLAIREKVLGKEHPSTATIYNNIGEVYHGLGDYPKALEYYQKSLEIDEKVLGKEHPSTATSYNNIGLVYKKLGDNPKALEYYQKSLAIHESLFGSEHPDTATSYNNIGLVYHNLGDYAKALEYQQKVLDIYVKVLGHDHPDTALSCKKVSISYRHNGDYEHAIEYALKALPMHITAFGENHIKTSYCHNSIALAYRGLEQYNKALEHFKAALEIRQSQPNPDEDAIQQSLKYIEETEKLMSND